MVEIGFDQAKEVQDIFKQNGLTTNTYKDLSGIQRVIIGTLPYWNPHIKTVK